MNFNLNNKIFIVPTNNKPVKIIFENKTETTTITRNKTQKESLMEIIKDMLRGNIISTNKKVVRITKQQYKSEKGKLRRNNFEEVINFIKKRDCHEIYQNKLNETINITTIKQNYPMHFLNNYKLGMTKI